MRWQTRAPLRKSNSYRRYDKIRNWKTINNNNNDNNNHNNMDRNLKNFCRGMLCIFIYYYVCKTPLGIHCKDIYRYQHQHASSIPVFNVNEEKKLWIWIYTVVTILSGLQQRKCKANEYSMHVLALHWYNSYKFIVLNTYKEFSKRRDCWKANLQCKRLVRNELYRKVQ